MSTTSTPITRSSLGGTIGDPTGLDAGPRLLAAGCGVDERRGGMKPWQRLVAVTWDSQFLCAQRAVYLVAPRLAVHLDELAHRRDDGRRKRS